MSLSKWNPTIDPFITPKHPGALSDIRPLLRWLVEAYGREGLARLLDVNPAMITRWRRGAKLSDEVSRRILDLHAVLARALQMFAPQVVTHWLIGHEPFLNDARPIDVLAVRGAAPLIQALDGIAAGTYP